MKQTPECLISYYRPREPESRLCGREETPSVIEKTEVPRLGTDWIAILEHPASWVFAALLAVIGVGLAFSDMLDHAPGGAKTEAGKRMAVAGLKYTDPFDSEGPYPTRTEPYRYQEPVKWGAIYPLVLLGSPINMKAVGWLSRISDLPSDPEDGDGYYVDNTDNLPGVHPSWFVWMAALGQWVDP